MPASNSKASAASPSTSWRASPRARTRRRRPTTRSRAGKTDPHNQGGPTAAHQEETHEDAEPSLRGGRSRHPRGGARRGAERHAALRRHPSRRLPDGGSRHLYGQAGRGADQGPHQDPDVQQCRARQREGHHRADPLRRHRHEPREHRAVQQPGAADPGARHALPVPLGRSHAQGGGRADRRRDPRRLYPARSGRPRLL